jgi:hypothetical protein
VVLGRRAQGLDISGPDQLDAAFVAVAYKSAAGEFSFADEQMNHAGTYSQHRGGFFWPVFLAPGWNVNTHGFGHNGFGV